MSTNLLMQATQETGSLYHVCLSYPTENAIKIILVGFPVLQHTCKHARAHTYLLSTNTTKKEDKYENRLLYIIYSMYISIKVNIISITDG